MLPYIDIINHQSHLIKQIDLLESDNGYIMKSLVDIAKDDEIYYNYDPNFTTADFFTTYGFVPEENCT